MGDKHFRVLEREKVLFVPSKRTLMRQRAKIPNTDGCDPEAFKLLRQLVICCFNPVNVFDIHMLFLLMFFQMDEKCSRPEDRDVLLIWDAMGYNAGIKYDKHTGKLIGYAGDFDFGLCVQQFSNKVNVLTVLSPQHNIELKFPIAHYHVNVLTRLFIHAAVHN